MSGSGWHVPYDGDFWDVEATETAKLHEIANEHRERLAGKQGPLWPGENRSIETDLDAIEEELEIRADEARAGIREEA